MALAFLARLSSALPAISPASWGPAAQPLKTLLPSEHEPLLGQGGQGRQDYGGFREEAEPSYLGQAGEGARLARLLLVWLDPLVTKDRQTGLHQEDGVFDLIDSLIPYRVTTATLLLRAHPSSTTSARTARTVGWTAPGRPQPASNWLRPRTAPAGSPPRPSP